MISQTGLRKVLHSTLIPPFVLDFYNNTVKTGVAETISFVLFPLDSLNKCDINC